METRQDKPKIIGGWHRVKNDIKGNPRYVCHFLTLVPDLDKPENWEAHGLQTIPWKYKVAVKRANKIGGRKYHNKSYGGGIVFQSCSLQDTEKAIAEIIEKEANA